MTEEQIREECLKMIEGIFEEEDDVYWPVPNDSVEPVQILGSEEGYVLATEKYGKEYDDVDDVLDVLIDVEKVYGSEDPLWGVHVNLSAVS